EFITLVGSAAMVWPLAARAQQSSGARRIGVLMSASENDPEYQAFLTAFREGLQKLGWAEGRNIQLDTRWVGLDTEATRRFAKELVGLAPISSFRAARLRPRRSCSKRAPSPSFSRTLSIRSAAALSRACRGRAATSPVSSISSRAWSANGWSCSKR